ncbi:riboflavin synthase alpha chain [Faunimonas pinastri]|uniref:Riboflavin synthase n=1 Tax=Faunimonas pinastri TaxID=1855383 RepID=A0A1H9CD39_9HYPH|nr:riboflavin synthase [Faunimonas pinastri]SEP99062.1 riboflavin synthase alpha chain [Faunimonas pinastri]
MFTGIVSDVGEVLSVRPLESGVSLRIQTAYDPDSIVLGASIACSGPCLTAVATGRNNVAGWFEVEASTETLARTTMGEWTVGRKLNLERALKAGDELGGHIVSGHVDGVARIVAREEEGGMARFTFEVPGTLARYIAEKGSVALDGTSLTVNSVEGNRFTIMVIPHTLAVTTWGDRKAGDTVNLEVDQFARYLERLIGSRPA